jgi:hypothetical protein
MATAKYNLASIMSKAWMTAKYRARRDGGSVRAYLAAAMREAWAFEKGLRIEMAASNARVQAAIEQIKASHTAEATAARAADMAGFAARCGMPECRSFSRRFYA